MHYTIATGPIASKEAAARYALEVFEPGWHALIEDALAYRRIAPSPAAYGRQPTRLVRDAAAFVAAFIEAANGAMAG